MYTRPERYDFDPFPYVQTDARYARNGDVTRANATTLTLAPALAPTLAPTLPLTLYPP